MKDYVYSDIQHPLIVRQCGNVGIVYDDDVIVQSIKSILATVAGERVRSPMGSSLLRYLFEPMSKNAENDIRDIMVRDIMKHEPRLSNLRVFVRANFDENFYDVIVLAAVNEVRRPIELRTRLNSMAT